MASVPSAWRAPAYSLSTHCRRRPPTYSAKLTAQCSVGSARVREAYRGEKRLPRRKMTTALTSPQPTSA
jgi:hypothetical protein